MNDHKVGYGKPPVHTRFKKGQSANPRGRPKRVPNPDDVLRKVLDRKINVKINGEKTAVPIRDALIHKVVELANSGDTRALKWLRKVHQRAYDSQPVQRSTKETENTRNEFMDKIREQTRRYIIGTRDPNIWRNYINKI